MLNIKNNKGSITLFVLVSCLFFIASVTCVYIYIQNKQISVDREYRRVKANYETNLENSNALDENYYKLSQIENIQINIEQAILTGNRLEVEFTLSNTTNLDIDTIKYGWGTNELIDTVSNWNYLEAGSINKKMIAINNNATNTDTYHLFVMINNKVIYTTITV